MKSLSLRKYVTYMTFAAISLLGGCSTVGPGFANHPLDCAMGIKWADCLPGTAGYNNGGGQQTRAIEQQREATEQQSEHDSIESEFQAALDQCKTDLSTSDLDPIRAKVELIRSLNDGAPPFAIASNDSLPTSQEHSAISKWATIREECLRREDAISYIPPSSNSRQVEFLNQDKGFVRSLSGKVGQLIVLLYQQKITYGEFASKRYQLSEDTNEARRQFRQASLNADEQRQTQAAELAQQEAQTKQLAWATYMQSVNARAVQTTPAPSVNCTSQRLGNTVNTNCY